MSVEYMARRLREGTVRICWPAQGWSLGLTTAAWGLLLAHDFCASRQKSLFDVEHEDDDEDDEFWVGRQGEALVAGARHKREKAAARQRRQAELCLRQTSRKKI